MEAFSSKILFDSSSLDQLNPCPSTTIYDSNYNKSSILDQPNNALSSSSHKQDIMISSSPLPNNNNNNVVNYYNNMMEYSSSLLTHDHKVVTPIINKTKYSSKHKHPSSPNSAQSTKDVREAGKKQKKGGKLDNGDDEEKKEYIHVRARRGQATDSHSLAERVRRERISERMKQLQALVPGCDKITGKALMLDEIINYVQSLQNQVEFLSMKLASVNPMFYDFGMDLESFMVGPQQQNLSIEECSTTTANPYHDLLLQQAQIPNVALQVHNNRQVLWEVDDQRQRIINQSEISNNLFSFH